MLCLCVCVCLCERAPICMLRNWRFNYACMPQTLSSKLRLNVAIVNENRAMPTALPPLPPLHAQPLRIN